MFAVGSQVVIAGLRAKPEYNGRSARLISLPEDGPGGRYTVEVDEASAADASVPKIRCGPETAFADSFLAVDDFGALGFAIKRRDLLADMQRTAADRASHGPSGSAAIGGTRHLVAEEDWLASADGPYDHCRPERRGRVVFSPSFRTEDAWRPPKGQHALTSWFEFRWALGSDEDASRYYEERVPSLIEDIGLTGVRVVLEGVHVDGADESVVQASNCRAVMQRLLMQRLGEQVHLPDEVSFSAVFAQAASSPRTIWRSERARPSWQRFRPSALPWRPPWWGGCAQCSSSTRSARPSRCGCACCRPTWRSERRTPRRGQSCWRGSAARTAAAPTG